MRHSNRVRHAFQARRALGAEGHIRTACPRTACNNCLKMYVKVWHYSLQITIISQLFAWYIQSQHIYSNKTYSSNFWQHISNTKVILQKRTIPNSVPEGHKETLSIYNHPPSVGIIYPIATYIFHSHIFPKLLAAYIQYKGYSSKTYITQLCARRAQRNPFNLQSSPKCCLVLSNRNICTFIFLVIAPTDELYIPIIYPHFAYIYNHVANNYKVHLQNVTSVYNAIYGWLLYIAIEYHTANLWLYPRHIHISTIYRQYSPPP